MARKITLCRYVVRIVLLFPILTFTATGFPSNPAYALTDSRREIPSNVPNWKFMGWYMDTGGVRACRATGEFNEYTIDIAAVPEGGGKYVGGYGFACNGMCDSITIKFKSSRPYSVGNTRGYAPSDYGTCATGRPTDAPAGTLHSNQGYAPYVDLCDGVHGWHAISEKTQPVELSLGDKSVVPGEVRYIIDLKTDPHFIYNFSAEFQPENMLDKLHNASMLKIGASEGNFQPVELNSLSLNQVAETLQLCLKGEK